jgi:hypothetical protein
MGARVDPAGWPKDLDGQIRSASLKLMGSTLQAFYRVEPQALSVKLGGRIQMQVGLDLNTANPNYQHQNCVQHLGFSKRADSKQVLTGLLH